MITDHLQAVNLVHCIKQCYRHITAYKANYPSESNATNSFSFFGRSIHRRLQITLILIRSLMIIHFLFMTVTFFCLLMVVWYLIVSLSLIPTLVWFKLIWILSVIFFKKMQVQTWVGKRQVLTPNGAHYDSDYSYVFFLVGNVISSVAVVRDWGLLLAAIFRLISIVWALWRSSLERLISFFEPLKLAVLRFFWNICVMFLLCLIIVVN